MEEFKVEDWAKEFELTADTVAALDNKGFNSYRSIKKLTQDLLKKEFGKTLNPGQFLLLQEAVEALQDPVPGPIDVSSDTNTAESSALSGRKTNNSAATVMPEPQTQGYAPQSGESAAPSMEHNPASAPYQAQLDKGVSLSAQDILGMVTGGNPGTNQPCKNITEDSNANGKTLNFDPITGSADSPTIKFRDIRDYIYRLGSKTGPDQGTPVAL